MSTKNGGKAALRKHRSQIGVSAQAYRERRLGAFMEGVGARKAIYLDVNYWIDLQLADAGKPRRDEFVALLSELRNAVAAGAAFCPPTFSLVMEIAKQQDETTRRATARLVDELSGGVGLVADDDIIGLEVVNLIQAGLAERPPAAPRSIVWTPLGLMAANGVLPPMPLVRTRQQQQRVQKAYFDTLMTMTAEELLSLNFGDQSRIWSDLASTLNEGAQAHAHEIGTFEKLLESELFGAAKGSAQLIQAGGNSLFERQGLSATALPSADEWAKLVFLAMKTNKDARRALPSLHVRAGLHALVRWNRTQKFKPNDVYDFAHAAAALGYCDLFLTEGPLKDLLGRGPLRLADTSDCTIVAVPDQALPAVRTLLDAVV